MRDPNQCFDPHALLSTNLDQTPTQILTWCIRRWTLEVTWEEARPHRGLETQRQWNARAIGRTTPALLSLSSIVTLTAHPLRQKEATIVRVPAWYGNICPTCADAMDLVRRHLWDQRHFSTSQHETDMIKKPMSCLATSLTWFATPCKFDKVELRVPYNGCLAVVEGCYGLSCCFRLIDLLQKKT